MRIKNSPSLRSGFAIHSRRTKSIFTTRRVLELGAELGVRLLKRVGDGLPLIVTCENWCSNNSANGVATCEFMKNCIITAVLNVNFEDTWVLGDAFTVKPLV
jgi:hypothetical protein